MEPTSGQGGDVCLLHMPGFLARCPLQQGHGSARGVSRCGGQGQPGMEGGGEGGVERGSPGMCARPFQKPRLTLLSRPAPWHPRAAAVNAGPHTGGAVASASLTPAGWPADRPQGPLLTPPTAVEPKQAGLAA